MDLRLLVLALESFAIGTGSSAFAGMLGVVAEDLPVSVANPGQLITLYAIVYAVGSPILYAVGSPAAMTQSLACSDNFVAS